MSFLDYMLFLNWDNTMRGNKNRYLFLDSGKGYA